MKFSNRNRLVNCRCCGKLTHSDVDMAGLELCRPCLEDANYENEHLDGYHDKPRARCPLCPKKSA